MAPVLRRLLGAIRPTEAFVLPPLRTREDASAAVRQHVERRWFRPGDAARFTRFHEPRLIFAPFWCVEVRFSGRMIYHFTGQGRDEGGSLYTEVIKNGWHRGGLGSKSADGITAVVMRSARSDAGLHSLFTRTDAHGTEPAWLPRAHDWVPLDRAGAILGDGEIIDADVTAEQVVRDVRDFAAHRLERDVVPRGTTIFKGPKVDARAPHFVLMPLHWILYDYKGEAAPNEKDSFHVVLDARSGCLLSQRHPSALRAVAGRVFRILSFNR